MGPRLNLGAGLLPVYVAKGARVYVSGLTSVLIPYYLASIGYGGYFVGAALVAILAGNAFSNLVLTFYERKIGTKVLLQAFSILMFVSGLALALSGQPFPILLGCFLGNVSTTGTEAGPFQSVEAGVLPELAPAGRVVKAFGRYNLIGYTASALGSLTLLVPGSIGGGVPLFRAFLLGFGVVGLLLFVIYTRLVWPPRQNSDAAGFKALSPATRKEVGRLSGLFSIDAFGGSFVSQYILSYWFFVVYGVPLAGLALIFPVASLISAGSTYGAAIIAERFGNLRTMVYTHIPSSVFLVLIPFAGSLAIAVVLLFLRQSMSQMDVPTRQALMAEMFEQDQRVPAYAITNTVRSVGAFVGGPVTASLLALGVLSGLLYMGGFSKIVYDISIYGAYRKRFR